MNELNQKIENARQNYNVKFLNEKFEDKDDNKVRKEKLNKLSENINEKYKIKTRR
jgi:uncharacterized FlaG/YvyC family protein